MKYLHTPLFNRSENKIINSTVFFKKSINITPPFSIPPSTVCPTTEPAAERHKGGI